MLPWWLNGKESSCQCKRWRFDPLKKEMATHSRILAWKIPWTEGPGGLQPMWSELDTAQQLNNNVEEEREEEESGEKGDEGKRGK